MSTYWTNALIDVLLFFFVIVCVLMGLAIMMQRSKQEGLGAAFGGGFTESVWGAQTSQVLVKATVWLAAFFFCISIVLARLYTHRANLQPEGGSSLHQQLLHPVAPATKGNVSAPGNPNPIAPAHAVVPTAATVPPPATATARTNAAPAPPAK